MEPAKTDKARKRPSEAYNRLQGGRATETGGAAGQCHPAADQQQRLARSRQVQQLPDQQHHKDDSQALDAAPSPRVEVDAR